MKITSYELRITTMLLLYDNSVIHKTQILLEIHKNSTFAQL